MQGTTTKFKFGQYFLKLALLPNRQYFWLYATTYFVHPSLNHRHLHGMICAHVTCSLQEPTNPFAAADDSQLQSSDLLRVKSTIPKAVSLVSKLVYMYVCLCLCVCVCVCFSVLTRPFWSGAQETRLE